MEGFVAARSPAAPPVDIGMSVARLLTIGRTLPFGGASKSSQTIAGKTFRSTRCNSPPLQIRGHREIIGCRSTSMQHAPALQRSRGSGEPHPSPAAKWCSACQYFPSDRQRWA
jgi:hypothetical protein